jgi:hypothetical protein
MKSFLYPVLLLSFLNSAPAFGQTKEKLLTEAEQFSSQAGTLIERQFIEIGKVKGIEVKVLKYQDLNSGLGKSALRFEFQYRSTNAYTTDTKVASLDVDEIEGLIKSIKNLQASVFPTTRTVYTEITFRSRTGFEAGAYFSLEKGRWSAYLQLERFDKNSLVFLTTDDFSALLDLIEQAKAKM